MHGEHMPTAVDTRIGTELAGYRIEALLGRGGMSVVYRARDLALQRRVALKVLAPELAEDERFRERFLRESRLAASIDHTNVIPIYEAGEAGGLLYIAMRYVEGTDLRRLLEREGTLEPERALAILGQVASALDTARFADGLVHRDVKPGNILLAAEPGPAADGAAVEHVYLSDFGLSKRTADEGSLTEGGQFLGTIDYVAPEQIEDEPVDGRADVYSLGCVLYECLTGQVPFRKDSKMALLWAHLQEAPLPVTGLRPDLPHDLDAVVTRAMAKSPDERYPTCRELIAAARTELKLATEENSVVVRPPSDRPLTRRLWLLVAVVALAGGAVVSAILISRGGESQPVPAIASKTLARIDPATNEPTATIPLGGTPSGVAVSDDAIWVSKRDEGVVLKIDPETNTVEKTLSVGGAPGGITVAGEPEAVWVANGTEGVTEILPSAGDRATTFDSGGEFATAVGFGDGSAWAANPHDDFVSRINPASGRIMATIGVKGWPLWVAVGDGYVWAGNLDGTVSRIDPKSNTVTKTIKVRRAPAVLGGAPAVALGEGLLWVTSFEDDSVLGIDPKTGQVARRIAIGGWPFWIAVGQGSLWVSNFSDKTVLRIDPTTGEVLQAIPVESGASIVAAGARGVWIAVGVVLGEQPS